MLQGLKSKKRHLILLSDVLNISNKSLTMALYSSRKKNCVVRTQHSSSNDYEVFSKKLFSSLGFYYTRFDKSNSLTKDQETFVTIFCSFSQLL